MIRISAFATTLALMLAFGACSDKMSVAKKAAAHTKQDRTEASSPEAESPTPDPKTGESDEESDDDGLLHPELFDIYPKPEESGVGADDESSSSKAEDGGVSGVVNLNSASLEELQKLPGVGPTIAERIADYRKKRRFEEVAHITRVRGIGDATFAKLKAHLAVDGQTTITN